MTAPDSATPPLAHAQLHTPRTRRILLISFTFPPAAAVGSLRWQKMAGHLRDFGWSIDAVTRDPADVEQAEPARLLDLPTGTRILGVRYEPLRLQRFLSAGWRGVRRLLPGTNGEAPQSGTPPVSRARLFTRGLYARLEYADMGRWARQAAQTALRHFRHGEHSVVVTSGPPHMAHEAGRLVAARTHAPLVVDMRDPWSLQETPRTGSIASSRTWIRLARRFEEPIVAQAALIVANTEAVREEMTLRYPGAKDRIIAIPNGYDDDPLPAEEQSSVFRLRFAGTIYDDTAPLKLFRAVRVFLDRTGASPARFQLEMVVDANDYHGRPLLHDAREAGIEPFVRIGSWLPRADVLRFLAQATMLVSLPQYSSLAVPAKLFEYIRFKAWILIMSEPGTATAATFANLDADIVAPDDTLALSRTIEARYLAFRRGVPAPTRVLPEELSRRTQAKRLAEALSLVVEKKSRDRIVASRVA